MVLFCVGQYGVNGGREGGEGLRVGVEDSIMGGDCVFFVEDGEMVGLWRRRVLLGRTPA